MREVPESHNGSSNGHERARWRRLHARLDELMRVQTRENLRNVDPRTAAIWTAGTLLGAAAWLAFFWLLVSSLS